MEVAGSDVACDHIGQLLGSKNHMPNIGGLIDGTLVVQREIVRN